MAKLLPRFLHGLKHSLDSDITNHAVIVGMNKGAKSLCDGLQARYSHHCILSPSWPGHETETDIVRPCCWFCLKRPFVQCLIAEAGIKQSSLHIFEMGLRYMNAG